MKCSETHLQNAADYHQVYTILLFNYLKVYTILLFNYLKVYMIVDGDYQQIQTTVYL